MIGLLKSNNNKICNGKKIMGDKREDSETIVTYRIKTLIRIHI